jgi:hypothetical protein
VLNKFLTLVLLATISVGGYLMYHRSPYADGQKTTETVLGAQVATDPLVVQDQFAIDDLLVDSVTMQAPGYVAIHSSFEGKPGPVIARSNFLEAGQEKDLVILLSEPIAAGSIVFVMIHEDDGDGVWEFPGDDGFRLDGDTPLMRRITIL